MNSRLGWPASGLALAFLALLADPAAAHHVAGGAMPSDFGQGLLSGLGHPVIGIDHFAAVLAVGCLAALRPGAPLLALAYVVATLAGAALHVTGLSLPAAEALVAGSVLLLGGLLMLSRPLPVPAGLALFGAVGLLHGYALGESIANAGAGALMGYFIGLAFIQGLIALGGTAVTRRMLRSGSAPSAPVRLIGAGVVAAGLAVGVAEVIGRV